MAAQHQRAFGKCAARDCSQNRSQRWHLPWIAMLRTDNYRTVVPPDEGKRRVIRGTGRACGAFVPSHDSENNDDETTAISGCPGSASQLRRRIGSRTAADPEERADSVADYRTVARDHS